MSLLKVNEVQNYNGSSLTLTASTVSTSAQLNTGGNISVTGSINVSDDSTTRSNLGLGSIATQDSDNVTVTGGTATLGALTVSGSDSGDLVRITQTGSGNALVVEDSTNPDSTPFVVDASGRVGIGASSFTSNQEFLKVSNTGAGLAAQSTIEAANDGTSILNFGDTDDFNIGRLSYSHSIDALSIYTNNSERMRINNDGRCDAFATSETLRVRTAATTAAGSIAIRLQAGATSITSGGTTEFQVTSNGNVANRNNSYGAISDIKLKENIVDANSQWEDLKALQVRNYNFKEGQTHTQIGLVAQEVELVSPGLVTESPNRDAEGNDLGTVTKLVNYSVLYMKAVKALQEAMERIESQQSQIDALTARIEALETA